MNKIFLSLVFRPGRTTGVEDSPVSRARIVCTLPLCLFCFLSVQPETIVLRGRNRLKKYLFTALFIFSFSPCRKSTQPPHSLRTCSPWYFSPPPRSRIIIIIVVVVVTTAMSLLNHLTGKTRIVVALKCANTYSSFFSVRGGCYFDFPPVETTTTLAAGSSGWLTGKCGRRTNVFFLPPTCKQGTEVKSLFYCSPCDRGDGYRTLLR